MKQKNIIIGALVLLCVLSGLFGAEQGLTAAVSNPPQQPLSPFDMGDAPEGAIAYPAAGVLGAFPTCINVPLAGSVQHTNFGAFFGPAFDLELEGNAGMCPLFGPNNYDADECFADGDAGLLFPEAFTIQGGSVVPCPNVNGTPLGNVCQTAVWGVDVDIIVTNNMPNQTVGLVNVLMDWDRNGSWAGMAPCPGATTPEHVLVDFVVPNGYTGPLSALGPPSFLIGPQAGEVWTRFSITEQPVGPGWTGEGMFEDGESEDYLLQVNNQQQDPMDWGDAEDPSYPTLQASNGARHTILPGYHLGASIDAEPNGQPNMSATGDDNDGNDDEDGIIFITQPLIPGQQAIFDVTNSMGPAGIGFLDAWVDFNNDGDWSDPGEQIAASLPLSPWPINFNSFFFNVPLAAIPQRTTTARFRFSSSGGLPYDGPATDGEVEDYSVRIGQNLEVKWLQPPDPTLPGLHAHDWLQGGPMSLVLADDWQCQGGLVTDFHWWGNYELDPTGQEIRGSGIDYFHLSIHDTDSISPCLPGPELYGLDVPLTALVETNTGLVNNEGSPIYLYEYDLTEPFVQIPGNQYWFDLTAFANNPANPPFWRWQEAGRSPSPNLCGAVNKQDPAPGTWQTITWPGPHFSDMAFSVTSTLADWGDAPDAYRTTLANNGPVHFLPPAGPFMGLAVDPELDGQPTALADGDDLLAGDDEDGVLFVTPLVPGEAATVTVDFLASPTGCYLNGWVDFDGDATWGLSLPEQIFTDVPLTAGTVHTLTFAVPHVPTSTIGLTYARFRCSSARGLTPEGLALDGEVEDYLVQILGRPQSPLVTPTIVTSRTLRLSWPHVITDVYGNPITVTTYHVFRHNDPYFDPLSPTWMLTGPFTTTVMLSDPTGLGAVPANHYYLVMPILYDLYGHALSSWSNRCGEFDYAVRPGSP